MDLKLDVLALAAHPDDVEISCSGTLISMVAQGKKVGIADFTRGELGTRGTAETRKEEAKVASEIMGIHWRTNLDLGDGFFEVDQEAIMAVIHALRTTQPDLLLINAPKDRHPDHGRAAELSQRAAFLSGLAKIKTPGLDPWRPKQILHYIQDLPLEPDVVVDISAHFDQRMEALLAYKTQFFDPKSTEPETPISGKSFLDVVSHRCLQTGRYIGKQYGEGFIKTRPMGVNDLTQLA